MRNVVDVLAFFVLALALGCALTNYPVITDTRGADGAAVVQSFYDEAFIRPTLFNGSIAYIYSDGSDELYTLVTQDWKGDQWLKTYNNFDPTATVLFLDQTYCDPVRQTDCPVVTAWNPDLPEAEWDDPHHGEPGYDDPWDYTFDTSCSGWRSAGIAFWNPERSGECGSSFWPDAQALAYEFAALGRASYRGIEYYHVPFDATTSAFEARGADGSVTPIPLFGRFNVYMDDRFRTIVPMTHNMKRQLRWLDRWATSHGPVLDLGVTYGSLTTRVRLKVLDLRPIEDRL
jgi:hypothetical protein